MYAQFTSILWPLHNAHGTSLLENNTKVVVMILQQRYCWYNIESNVAYDLVYIKPRYIISFLGIIRRLRYSIIFVSRALRLELLVLEEVACEADYNYNCNE